MNTSCDADPFAGPDADSTQDGRGDEPDDLDRICAELHVDRETAAEFAANYLSLLSSRLERIDRELDLLTSTGRSPAVQLNIDPAVVALLSLDASSVMLGAFEVSLAAQRLRRDVQTDRLDALREPRRELHRAAERLRVRLTEVVADGR